MIDKGYQEVVIQTLKQIKATGKGFNPVYEDWIKKINKNDKLPRGKYFKKKKLYIIDTDPSIMNILCHLSLVEYNPFTVV